MKLTTRSRYGTRMVLDIAQHADEGPVRIGDIAKRQKVSVKYLEKLIRELRDAGLVTSRRGPKGGHVLGRAAEDISVGEVVRVLEGNRHLVYCVRGKEKCERSDHCLTRKLWHIASEAMFEKLDSISFADLVNDQANCLAGRGIGQNS
jgi:Rrf2 family protein